MENIIFKINILGYDDGWPIEELEICSPQERRGEKILVGVNANSVGPYGESTGFHAYYHGYTDPDEDGGCDYENGYTHALFALGGFTREQVFNYKIVE